MDIKNNKKLKTLIHVDSKYFENKKPRILFSTELSYYCKMKCKYCFQSNHDDKTKLNLKIFDKIIKKIHQEYYKSKKEISFIQFNIHGGELTDLDFEYNQEIFKLIRKYTNYRHFKFYFLTNFAFDLNIFRDELFKTFNKNTQNEILITIHPFISKFKDENKIIEDIKVIKDKINFEIQFFNQFRNKLFPKLYDYLKSIDKIDLSDDNNEHLIDEIYFKDKNCYCLPFEYNITPTGKIIDTCRKIEYNFLNLKIKNNWIKCNLKNCSTAKNFYQNIKKFKD